MINSFLKELIVGKRDCLIQFRLGIPSDLYGTTFLFSEANRQKAMFETKYNFVVV